MTVPRRRATSTLLVLVVLAGTSAVAFGGGYRASQALLDDGTAWLVKGTTVAQVNGETGRSDAEVVRDLATGEQPLETVRYDGGVYVVNSATGEVTRVDGATKQPEATAARAPGSAVQVGGGTTWVSDAEGDVVEQLDPATLQPLQSVPVPQGVDAVAVDGTGTAWVLSRATGEVRAVREGRVQRVLAVAAPDALTSLTTVGDRAVVVDGTAGRATRLRGGSAASAEQPVAAPALRGVDARVARPSAVGGVLFAAVDRGRTVVRVDLDRRSSSSVALPAEPTSRLGAPVLSRDRVAVPDPGARELLLLDRDLRLVAVVPVPTTGPSFQLVAQGDRFYASEPYRRVGVVVSADGSSRPIDKGEGHGVREPGDEGPAVPAPTAPSAPSTPSVPQQPVRGPSPTRPELPLPGVALPDLGPLAPAVPSAGPSGPPGPAAPETPAAVAVPEVVGQDVLTACSAVSRAGLVCDPQEDPEASGGRGEVVDSDPPAGTQVPSGSTVVLRHVGGQQVPDVRGSTVEEACAAVAASGMRCVGAPRDQAGGPGEKARVVLEQTPEPGDGGGSGTAVRVVFNTRVQVLDHTGQDPTAACASAGDLGLQCTPRNLGSAAGTGRPVGQVVAQDRAAGSTAAPGDALVVDYYGDANRTVGDYRGLAPADACARAGGEGFPCRAEVRHPYRTPNVVQDQSVPPSSSVPDGTEVVVYYDDRAPAALVRYKKTDDEVWVYTANPERDADLRSRGYSPDGSNAEVFYAYGTGTPQSPQMSAVVSATCTCDQHAPNHWYGTSSPPTGYAVGSTAFYVLTAPVGDQTAPLYRLRRERGTQTKDFTMAVEGSGAWSFYLGQGFTPDGPAVGWVWR